MATITETAPVEIELLRSEPSSPLGPSRPEEGLDGPSRHTQELKPVDRGRDAWTMLIAGVIFEALFWGFPMCFGVFQAYYTKLPEFADGKSSIALVGTFAQSLCQVLAPLSALATRRFPRHLRTQTFIGWLCAILGLLCASFCDSVGGLIATQGVLYGVGFVTMTYPIISILNEWWVSRKGMAFGAISASSGITGAGLPFILDALLDRYGHRTTLRACTVAMVILTLPLLPVFRPRLPVPEQSSSGMAPTDWSFVKRPLFWIYSLSIFVQSIGFSFPVIFLASYAASAVGLPSLQGALLVAVMSVSQVLGQFTFGWLSDHDRLSVNVLASGCCLASAAATLILWGLSSSLGWLLAFSIVYGFFAFGFGTMRVAMGRAVSSDHTAVLATYSIFVAILGFGNVFVGPISAALLRNRETIKGHYAADSYTGIVLLTGLSSVAAALIITGWSGWSALRRHVHVS